jgi:hypothetical protein
MSLGPNKRIVYPISDEAREHMKDNHEGKEFGINQETGKQEYLGGYVLDKEEADGLEIFREFTHSGDVQNHFRFYPRYDD